MSFIQPLDNHFNTGLINPLNASTYPMPKGGEDAGLGDLIRTTLGDCALQQR